MANVATVRAMTFAIDSPPAPHRVDSETSAATITDVLLSWSNSRVIRGLKLVSVDWAQSMAEGRSPGCQSRRPARSWPGPWTRLGWMPLASSCIRRRTTSSTSRISSQDTSESSASKLMEWAPGR